MAPLADPSLDVVMVGYNARDRLVSSLEHLRRQTVAHRVILADNASSDGTPGMVRDRFPEVHLIQHASNLGFGRACNAAARAGDGEVIVLVNDDMDAEPRFLERLVAPLGDSRVGMVAGLTLQRPDGAVDGFGIELDPTLNAYSRLRHGRPTDVP